MKALNRFLLVVWLGWALPQLAIAKDLETTAEHLMIQNILKTTGVMALIYQIPSWIDQEIEHLQATPVPFDNKELAVVREDLENNFSSAQLKKNIVAALSKEFDSETLRTIRKLLKSPHIKKFHSLQENTQSEYIQADIRSYKAKIKNDIPRGARVDMVEKLDGNLHQSEIETDLKVELRKSLLTSVSWVKSKEILSEKTLDRELLSYKQRVGEEINYKALIFYLYLFKRTPSDQLTRLVDSYGEPAFIKFMDICHQEMLSSIKTARRKIPENINLAGS